MMNWEEEEEDDVDWRMPSEAASTSIKSHSQQAQPSSLLTHGSESCLKSRLGHSRTIIHIDLDCFYAQVEMLRNPTLRDKPLGIQQKNIVVTTNYVARARGVSKLSYIKDALIKCPDLVLVSGEDLTNYRETSTKVTEVLEQFCPLVERLGFDENFMDVTQLVESRLSLMESKNHEHVGHSYGDDAQTATQCHCGCRKRLTVGSSIASEMRDTLKSKLGLTSCAGIATNKLLAKLVGGHHKPNDQTVLFSEWTDHFMKTFTKLRQIPGIGHSSGKKLKSMGIENLEELRLTPVSVLSEQFAKQQAETMLRLASGVDDTPVISKGLPQSLSDEDSFKKVGTLPAAKEMMKGLIQNLIKRLRSDGRIPHTMRLTVRKYMPGSWHRESRQTPISPNLFNKQQDDGILLNQLLDIAVGLLQKLIDTSRPFHLTLINICFTNLRSKVTKGALDTFFSKPTLKPQVSGTSQQQSRPNSEGNAADQKNETDDSKQRQVVQLTESEFWNKRDSATSSESKTNGDEGNVLVNQAQEPNINRRMVESFRTVKEEDGVDTKESPSSFFNSLRSSPSSKSKALIHREKSETREHNIVEKDLRENINPTTGRNSHTLQGVCDGHSLLDKESCSQTMNVMQQSTKTSVESSTVTSEECKMYDSPVKRVTEHNETRNVEDEKMKAIEIPPDIDRSVFDALPSNMKEELIGDWKRAKRHREDEHHLPSSSQNLPKKKKLLSSSAKRKQLTPVRNTITKYFKH